MQRVTSSSSCVLLNTVTLSERTGAPHRPQARRPAALDQRPVNIHDDEGGCYGEFAGSTQRVGEAGNQRRVRRDIPSPPPPISLALAPVRKHLLHCAPSQARAHKQTLGKTKLIVSWCAGSNTQQQLQLPRKQCILLRDAAGRVGLNFFTIGVTSAQKPSVWYF